ncbi:MAG: hypothetical protein HDR51_00320 [Treponema sp.]|nr:hypothetical protein [Treponema sp.]
MKAKVSRSVKEQIMKMSKLEFNRCMQDAAAEIARNAIQIRTGIVIHSLFVDNIYNILDVKRMFMGGRHCDAYQVEEGDTILFRDVTVDDLRRDISGVFIIADKNISKDVFPVYANYEALDNMLHIVTYNSCLYPATAIVGIAIATIKASPLFDMVLDR